MHPNPIARLKDNMFAPLIGFGRMHTISLFNLLSHTLMECLHHPCFTIAIQTNPFINGKAIKSIGVKGFNPYTISKGENSVVECTL
jgi:hypothetical protein